MAIVIPTLRSFTYLDDGDPPVVTTNTACIVCAVCPIIFTAANTGRQAAAPYSAYQYQVTGMCTPNNRTLQVIWDGFGTIGNRFQLKADGVDIFDSGCTAGSGTDTSVVLPAGTVQFDAIVTGACSATGLDLWAFQAGCLT